MPPENRFSVPFELASLSRAKNYQKWVFKTIEPFLGRRILEIGAGIGNMSQWLPIGERLILSENDPALTEILRSSLVSAGKASDSRITVREFDINGSDYDLLAAEHLDTIVSFNVLEHIERDHEALARLCGLLRSSRAPGPKRLLSFVPAHNWAYGSMDRAFGHHRRYSRRRLTRLCREVAPEARLVARHFNAFGLVGWIVNGRILNRPHIGTGAIETFERLCPWLAPVDDLLHEKLKLPLGQSLLLVLEWA